MLEESFCIAFTVMLPLWLFQVRKVQRKESEQTEQKMRFLHEVSLEEGSQLPLGRRVREVSDIESASLCSAGQDCLIVGSIGGLVTTGGSICRLIGN